ncbi:hypothetical protein F4808DRAFT_467097 [Astrocystis sublimbata]|nr:hypothetical protein F4808DRAFT_467097 [Astrocystis sublimbata]
MEQQPPEQIQSELENFRRQWREEVSSRTKKPATTNTNTTTTTQAVPASSSSSSAPGPAPRPAHRPGPSSNLRRHEPLSHSKGPTPAPTPATTSTSTPHKPTPSDDEDEDYVPTPVFEGDASSSHAQKGRTVADGKDAIAAEPKTALDFYEHAVERETTGKLGDSLQLYRKAFRMDDAVDVKYRDKHFAGRWAKPGAAAQDLKQKQRLEGGVGNERREGGGGGGGGGGGEEAGAPPIPLSYPELLASFASLAIEGLPPPVEGVEAPPCPFAELPDEILLHILRDVAVFDVGDFVRLSQVCKRLAYLVATEDGIWRRVCLGSEFGFGAMHRHFQTTITWEALSLPEALAEAADVDVDAPEEGTETREGEAEGSRGEMDEAEGMGVEVEEIHTLEDLAHRRSAAAKATTLALHRNITPSGYATWKAMFRRRPRVRFNGCYISTVNYIRPGMNSGQHLTWNTPVHIVTYYRYLRLFRDGTALSLLTTDEPAHVVQFLTRENVPSQSQRSVGAGAHGHGHHHGQHASHLPQPVMASVLKGRWRLSSSNPTTSSSSSTTTPEAQESDLYIETEGVVGAKYIYKMDLVLQNAGRSRGARNNKLGWRGFWSYNRLTDDWAQFTLKNDKPFFFSRVKSYGVGE